MPIGAVARDCPQPPDGARQISNARFALAYRTDPREIAVGRHFAVEFSVCPAGGLTGPESVRVDAHMPAHRHGMNYKTLVSASPGGHYRAEGLMFHMPGRWELVFELRVEDRTERLTQDVVIE